MSSLRTYSGVTGDIYPERPEPRLEWLDRAAASAAIPAVKRAIRRGKMKLTTINKQNRGQVEKLYLRFAKLAPEAPKESTVLQNSLMDARNAAGLTLGQVARELDITYKAAWNAEHTSNPKQDTVDKYLIAIANLTGLGKNDRAMVSFPAVSKPKTYAAAAAAAPTPVSYGYNDPDGYGDEEEEEEDSDY